MNKRISLNGTWALRWSDGERGGTVARLLAPKPDLSRALQVNVPGEVHLDLIRQGLLAEPTLGLNCLAARWVEENLWFYYRTFNAPVFSANEHAFLTFEGLDLAATIYLNGQVIGSHNNAFYPCTIDITSIVKEGDNSLVVTLDSGLYYAGDKPATGYGMSVNGLLHKRNWLRKTQSSFGWDWSPRLLNVGIHGDVYLDICEKARFDTFVALTEVSDDFNLGTVTGRVFVEGLVQNPQKGVLTVEIEGTGLSSAVEVDILPGLHPVQTSLVLPKPRLWWPVNHGDQPLYLVTATLTVDGLIIASVNKRVGFRRVHINQSVHPEGGNFFIIEINGKPMFAKGGNFVPADPIFIRLDRTRYQLLIDRAIEANFNLLRVWGGGLYESDDFYELCDEYGILVWQEFIFACAKYPIQDADFLADVKREAVYQVRRLANHPSLVVWCGNNEMEEGNFNWHYGEGVAYPDYALFHMVLPVILKEEDGTRFYQPSSPFSPDHEPPRRDDMGDQHPWTVGFSNTDFRDYREMICRFPNEGGILGPTSLPTVLSCFPTGSEKSSPFNTTQGALASFAWENHDNGIAFWDVSIYPDVMLQQWLGKEIASMSLEDYVYFGGILQGEGLSEYIRNFRRRMLNSASAIFWMYNDCWPATRSWTIVDHYGRRTPSFYLVRRAFQPLTVGIAVETDRVRVFGINEGLTWKGDLHWGLFAMQGGFPLDIQIPVNLAANASSLIDEFPLSEWQRHGVNSHGAFAILSQDGREIARDRLFLPFFKDLDWPEARVSIRQEANNAIFESQTFAWRVCLDLDGEKALPDNFFDVYPGIPTVIQWSKTLGKPNILRIGNLSDE